MLKRFLKCEDGATAIEYGLIASLIALAIIGGFSNVGTAIGDMFGSNDSAINSAFNG